MTHPILLVGQPTDPPLAAVHEALLAQGNHPILFDRRTALQSTIEITTANTVEGQLRLPAKTLDLAKVCSVYLRPLESRGPATDLPAALQHLQTLQDILYAWADLTPALVLNRPTPMTANDSKPFQSAWLRTLGFLTPATLLTTDPAAAEAFWQLHTRVIYKSLSGTRSIVSELTPAHRDRLAHIAACPTQFQQHIPGQDYRVHVVDDQLFPTVIHSSATDYRYAEIPFQAEPCTLPDSVATLCRHAAQAMQLTLAGIDLRRTPQGEWFCFEVNPSPAFTSFEDPTTQPIAHAVAHLLASS